MGTIEKTRPTTKPDTATEKPKLYRVVLLNDHYTRIEVVIVVLQSVFKLGDDRAFHVMKTAHQKGACVIAVYTLEIAETKVKEAQDLAKEYGAALGFDVEPD